MSPSLPIIVIDAGPGGLAVVRALRTVLPHEHFVYFADTARGPWGNKSAVTVTAFARQVLHYVRRLEPKHLIIACDAAAAMALPALKKEFRELSLSGVVEPAARAALEAGGTKSHPVIGIMASEAAIRSKAFERVIHARRNHSRLLMRPARLLPEALQEGRDGNDPLLRLALAQYLEPLVKRACDVVVLGSPVHAAIKVASAAALGPKVTLIDSSQACAQDVARRLQATGLLRGGGAAGALHCVVTDDTPAFRKTAAMLLGAELAAPHLLAAASLESAAMVPGPKIRASA